MTSTTDTNRLRAEAFIPLTHLSYHVLLAFAGGPLHGYAVLKEIETRTTGEIELQTGTLYTAIRRLQDEGLLRAAQEAPGGADRRRRYYELSALGAAVLQLESERFLRLIAVAQEKRVLGASLEGIA